MTDIQPIITLAIDSSLPHAAVEPSPMISFIFQWLGIPMTTATIILVMFAGWGVWHWILMANNARLGFPNFLKIVKRYMEKPKGA
jgi:hypothetical protein